MNPAVLLGVGALGLIALSGGRKRSKGGAAQSPIRHSLTSENGVLVDPIKGLSSIGAHQSLWPEMAFDIPFASGISAPFWPLHTEHDRRFDISYRTVQGTYEANPSRRFMHERTQGRYHVGVDLYCRNGDPVLACEDGTIVNIYHFYHGAYCILVQCDSGLVINYAEVAKDSWKDFGLSEGSRVKRGKGIAYIGKMSGGSSMLHFETYMRPTDQNKRYRGGAAGPILNPTYYLMRMRALAMQGRVYAGTEGYCDAQYWQRDTTDPSLEPLAELERELDVAPQDSVLAELNVDGKMPQEFPDVADGP